MRDERECRSPEIEAMQRALNRRARALDKTLLPCPKCAERPQIDFGLLDAPHPPGEEFISCPAVLEIDGRLLSCAVASIGAAHWNFRRVPA
jgi:hypothetical protein